MLTVAAQLTYCIGLSRLYSTVFILPNVVTIQSERLIKTSLSDGVKCTHGSCVANLLYKFELIVINGVYSTQCSGIINGVYSTQCRVGNIQ